MSMSSVSTVSAVRRRDCNAAKDAGSFCRIVWAENVRVRVCVCVWVSECVNKCMCDGVRE